MTKLFERAIETVRTLPPETQDALARIVLQLVQENDLPPISMSVEGETSFDQAIQDFWAKHGPQDEVCDYPAARGA